MLYAPANYEAGGTGMSNRRFEMHQYRQVVFRMRLGESDRTIARAGLMGRRKAGELREIAHEQGWLGDGPLPEDTQLAPFFQPKKQLTPPLSTHQSPCFCPTRSR
jgi:hypothetical protein